MEKHYTPENVVISVAGNIPEGLLEHIENIIRPISKKSIVSKIPM